MAQMNHTYSSMNSRMYMADSGDKTAPPEGFLWKLVLITGLAYLVWTDKIAIVLDPFAGTSPVTTQSRISQPSRASLFSLASEPAERPKPKQLKPVASVKMPDGKLTNTTLAMDPDYARRNGLAPQEASAYLNRCKEYIGRFAPLAVAEMHKYGIPASITLAQALLESNAGESKLAKKTNNHFGVKCFSSACRTGHCQNFSDDSHKDFFICYNSVWGSFRGHSQLLKNNKRYAPLFQLDSDDYQHWARGLTKAGYATNKQYGDMLIALIENLDLAKFDQQ
ncbi:MAG: glucosaminidase domain-containing protein [Lewinellaceae bacterium]|nr:glucosaminidase domain-containing protein [Lewinellaceae bacterium]